jgi:hypothetical protein
MTHRVPDRASQGGLGARRLPAFIAVVMIAEHGFKSRMVPWLAHQACDRTLALAKTNPKTIQRSRACS